MKFIKSLYLTPRFFQLGIAFAVIAILGFKWTVFTELSLLFLALTVAFGLIDIYLLYGSKGGLVGKRVFAELLSNGDNNEVNLFIESRYAFKINVDVLDEAPEQFQLRNLNFEFQLEPRETKVIDYQIKPSERGDYQFGVTNSFVTSFVGLVSRRFKLGVEQTAKVYPSIIQMKKADLQIFSKIDLSQGIKKVRKVGQHTEFEEIKEYNSGDDYRRINWKATARKGQLMLNVFQEEKSRPIYTIINKGRTMQMPFNGLSLFDYAVNAALATTNIILKRSDKAGLITFEKNVDTLLAATSGQTQLKTILELLYAEKTRFAEPNYYDLFLNIKRKISQRSVLLFFTSFESHSSLEQQLPIFKKLNMAHVLVVIFFENTELKKVMEKPAKSMEEIYQLAIAEKFDMEKRVILKELSRNGIQSILTKPESLTIDTINKYLEIKAKGLI